MAQGRPRALPLPRGAGGSSGGRAGGGPAGGARRGRGAAPAPRTGAAGGVVGTALGGGPRARGRRTPGGAAGTRRFRRRSGARAGAPPLGLLAPDVGRGVVALRTGRGRRERGARRRVG